MLVTKIAIMQVLAHLGLVAASLPSFNLISESLISPPEKATSSCAGLSVDNEGNVFPAGFTTGNLTAFGNLGKYDMFVQKYSANGTLLWTNQFGTELGDFVTATATDATGNVYAAGYCGLSSTDPSATATFYGTSTKGSADVCFAKFDSTGKYVFSGVFGGTDMDRSFGIALYGSSFYLAGNSIDANEDGVGFILQYDANSGELIHQYQNPTSNQFNFEVAVDSVGNLWTICRNDPFVLTKLSPTFESLVSVVGPADTTPGGTAVDDADNVYACGYTDSTTVNGLTNHGEDDIVVMKYSSAGEVRWTVLIGGTEDDKANSITVDNANQLLYITGSTSSPSLCNVTNNNIFATEFLLVLSVLDGSCVTVKFLHVTDYYYNGQGFAVAVNQNIVAVAGLAGNEQYDAHGTLFLMNATGSGIPLPTMSPSAAPTTYPTSSAPQSASFLVTQPIEGISFAAYSSNVALHSSTLVATIAQQMIGVSTDDIHDFMTVAGGSSAVRSHIRSPLRATLATDYIVTTYTVSTTSKYSATELASQLTSSIESGVFDTALHAQAQAAGATSLATATSGQVVITATPPASGDSNDGLSDGAIACIVIGALAGVIIFAALLWYGPCCRKRTALADKYEVSHIQLA